MLGNIEYIERNQSQPKLLLDVCRRNSDRFISFENLKGAFGWSFGFAQQTVVATRRFLTTDALYTISWEGGFVYKPKTVKVGDRISPLGLRPDPGWVSEFPQRQDVRALLKHLRFATVVSDTEATPLLTSDEHLLFMLLLANNATKRMSTVDQLSRALDVSESKIYSLFSEANQKFSAETQGEWTLGSQRHGGLCYMLKHNTV
jgi:hypothetical protein